MKKINFKDKKGITMIVLIVMIIIMTIIIGGATTLVGNQVVSKKIADLEAAMNWYKNEIDSYYLLKSDLPVRDLTNDEKVFVQDFITNYNQDILKLSSKYFMGRDGRNARMQSMNYSDTPVLVFDITPLFITIGGNVTDNTIKNNIIIVTNTNNVTPSFFLNILLPLLLSLVNFI